MDNNNRARSTRGIGDSTKNRRKYRGHAAKDRGLDESAEAQ